MATGMRFAGWLGDEQGQGLVEYGLLLLLVSTATLLILPGLGDDVSALYTKVFEALP
jgi:Flp pilus assembly pilin Flp